MSARQQRAATSHVTNFARLRSWLFHHFSCLDKSLLHLSRTPLASLLTMAVIGIALALPGGLYMLTKNLLNLSTAWDDDTQITLYLKKSVNDQQAKDLALKLNNPSRYASIRFLSRDQALQEFRLMTGFDEALDKLDENPLPATILLTPASHLSSSELETMLTNLKSEPQVELAQLDLYWVKRLHSIIQIAQRGLMIVFALLAAAVILMIGNTIRLEIENRRDEIVITKLFGATHSFIRRPFLYDGLWFGLLGGLLACLLIIGALWLLSGPVDTLIALYDSSFQPVYPDFLFILTTILFGGLLGYIGAWAAVSQHLHKIEPT